MELKKGYKQTDIGIIPEDWEAKKIDQVASVFGGGTPNTEIGSFWCGDINWFTPTEVGYNKYLFESNRKLTKAGLKYSSARILQPGSILLTSRAGIGDLGILKIEAATNQGFQSLITNSNISNEFLYYLMLTKKKELIQNASGSTFLEISPSKVKNIQIQVPPLKEQTAIANALSDTDSYITSLEKLIEKKRQIKQGAMQELLKPKDGWETKHLSDIGKTFGGLSGKSKDDFTEGVYPYIPFMNIMSNPIIDTEYFDYVNLNSGESQNLALKGDLFFNGSSETPEEVGMCSVLLNNIPNLYLNSFCFGFRIKSALKINGLYLSYYFRSKEGRKLFFSMAQGATRYNLSKSNFNKLKVPIPTIEEQNVIAERLFDLDSDIKIHEVKLEKAKSIKQGMMQNLLTGKIRLK